MAFEGKSVHLGWIETTHRARDPNRVYFVNQKDGAISDVKPLGIPPIITGVAVDGKRVLVDDGSGISSDIMPDVIGLTAQGFAAVQYIYKK